MQKTFQAVILCFFLVIFTSACGASIDTREQENSSRYTNLVKEWVKNCGVDSLSKNCSNFVIKPKLISGFQESFGIVTGNLPVAFDFFDIDDSGQLGQMFCQEYNNQCLAFLEYTNIGGTPWDDRLTFELIGVKNTYASKDEEYFIEPLNPGIKRNTIVEFEVPNFKEDYTDIRVSDDYTARSWTIPICTLAEPEIFEGTGSKRYFNALRGPGCLRDSYREFFEKS